MRGINKFTLIGNLGQDPEIRHLNDGKMATLSVATSESWKDKRTGERIAHPAAVILSWAWRSRHPVRESCPARSYTERWISKPSWSKPLSRRSDLRRNARTLFHSISCPPDRYRPATGPEALETRGHVTSQAWDWFEGLRDRAAELFSVTTGSPWMPARGYRTRRAGLTAAVVDSREFLAASERKKNLAMVPEGPKVVVAGGMDFNDHTLVWAALDKAHAKHPDIVLVHGGAPKGTDLIAARWAETRKIDQVVFKPDWKRDGKKRAGFLRNDRMLNLMPLGGLTFFHGTGVTENLVDKARGLGIPAKQYA